MLFLRLVLLACVVSALYPYTWFIHQIAMSYLEARKRQRWERQELSEKIATASHAGLALAQVMEDCYLARNGDKFIVTCVLSVILLTFATGVAVLRWKRTGVWWTGGSLADLFGYKQPVFPVYFSRFKECFVKRNPSQVHSTS